MMTNKTATALEDEMPEWSDDDRMLHYKCEHCGYRLEIRVHRKFIFPERQEEHMNRWGYPCSCTTLTLQ